MVSNKKYQLVLASQSPRRKELLGWIDVPFIIFKSEIEEHSESHDPVTFAEEIASSKGNDVWDKLEGGEYSNPFIVAADTIVEFKGEIFGKPKNEEEAESMLMKLSGQTHNVVTSVFFKAKFAGKIKQHVFSIKTEVTFNKIDKDILAPYLTSKESLDKAGAYGIQGKGLTFVKSIKGSYSNVVGFPLVEFLDSLKDFLEWNKASNWRENFQ